jgi:hypothetical protein
MNKLKEPEIPVPILLNCWKHHAAFIRELINNLNKNSKSLIDNLLQSLLTIGESQMDLYTGDLSPVEIANQVKIKLLELSIHSIIDYKNWILSEGKEYKLIKLSDDSIWTLLIGVKEAKYVHIHPARNSINTIRVKATTLKTALLVLVWVKIYGGSSDNLEIINKVRYDFISEPPLKKISANKGLQKLIRVLEI